ncbi:MAG: DoxX family protein [Pseudonocardiales bacterium]|nr:MAG: DoxX family protein [Pseudonocardiales bacterium]
MTTTLIETPPTPRRTVALHKTLWVVQILMAVFFLVAAAGPKLAGQQYAVQMFDQIGAGQWLRYFVGVCELAGAIGLMIPRLTALAATGLTALMAGAIITNVVVLDDPVMAITPAVLLAVFAWVAWSRRPRPAGSTAVEQ